MMKATLRIILCLGAILIPALNVWAGEVALKKATFIPQWVPQAQFAGYYMAKELGIYKRYGIDLTILTGGPDRAAAEFLRDGMADFATLWLSKGIQMRSEGIKVLNIGQMLQRSALMLVTKKKSGIRHPKQMEGKKVGLWGADFQIQPLAFFRKYNVNVKIIRQSYSVNLFLRDGVDVASAMLYNEYHTIIDAGINEDELVPFFFHEHALNFPEDGIYTLEDTYVKDPDLCRAFVRASVEGWRYAFANPDKAVALVLQNLRQEHLPAQRVHQKWMLEKIRDLTMPQKDLTTIGKLHPADFETVTRVLKSSGLIETPPSYGSFYRRCYLHD